MNDEAAGGANLNLLLHALSAPALSINNHVLYARAYRVIELAHKLEAALEDPSNAKSVWDEYSSAEEEVRARLVNLPCVSRIWSLIDSQVCVRVYRHVVWCIIGVCEVVLIVYCVAVCHAIIAATK